MSFLDFTVTDALVDYRVNDPIKENLIPTKEIYFSTQNGYGVYVCEDKEERILTVAGNFVQPLFLGQTYEFNGTVGMYNGEKQILCKKYFNVKPFSKKGIISYLQTLDGLKSKAYLIYDYFGEESIEILVQKPDFVVSQIKGIGKKSVEKWQTQLKKMESNHRVLIELYGYGVSINDTKRLIEKYGDSIIRKINENPYFLSKEITGFGFVKCDKIAREIGFDMSSEFRIQEGILYCLDKLTSFGHVYITPEKLIAESINVLSIVVGGKELRQIVVNSKGQKEVDYYIDGMAFTINISQASQYFDSELTLVGFSQQDIAFIIYKLSKAKAIVLIQERVYPVALYEAEIRIAKKIDELAGKVAFPFSEFDLKAELDSYLSINGITLDPLQYEAIFTVVGQDAGFFVLTGIAGAGKTFVLKIIIEMLKRQYKAISKTMMLALFAPTGKASKVASRATQIECKTIHRGLQYQPGSGFFYNEDNPLEKNFIIVDESSMLDTLLADSLLCAIREGAKVIFMGDIKQLQSIGSGNILSDIIASSFVDVIQFNVPQRQKKSSGIYLNASKITEFQEISTSEDTKDFYVLYKNTGSEILDTMHRSIRSLMTNKKYSLEDIQILVPQKTGILGTNYLNYFIQEKFNPMKGENEKKALNKKFDVFHAQTKTTLRCELYFRKNDKVIHISNKYDMNWYEKTEHGTYKLVENLLGITNGETGIIEEIEEKTQDDIKFHRIIVNYDGKYVFYDQKFQDLEHAYALTIHKSQGSQWKAVITIFSETVNPLMLVNNIAYTAITRSIEFGAYIGSRKALLTAIRNDKAIIRNTTLKELLIQKAS